MEKTICSNCKQSQNRGRNSRLAILWKGRVSPICKAYPLPPVINHVTGTQMPQGYSYCHTRNKDGRCPRFERA